MMNNGRILTAGFLLLSLAAAGNAQSHGAQTSGLGNVKVITSCPGDVGSFPWGCRRLLVETPHNQPVGVDLRVLKPNPNVRLRGTVVLGTGAGGATFMSKTPAAAALAHELAAQGFLVVDRKWLTGWFSTGMSVKQQSSRYATLITWIRKNLHREGAFCAYGSSGGSAEIAYALSTWRRGAILDVAVLGGGPPMSRLDFLCLDPAEWTKLGPPAALEGILECTLLTTNPKIDAGLCQIIAPGLNPRELQLDSILHPGAELDYPGTIVRGLFGTGDCTTAVPLGLMYVQSVTSRKSFSFVPETQHRVQMSELGREAIVATLLAATDLPGHGGRRKGNGGGKAPKVTKAPGSR